MRRNRLIPNRAFSVLAKHVVERLGHQRLQASPLAPSQHVHCERHFWREKAGDLLTALAAWGGGCWPPLPRSGWRRGCWWREDRRWAGPAQVSGVGFAAHGATFLFRLTVDRPICRHPYSQIGRISSTALAQVPSPTSHGLRLRVLHVEPFARQWGMGVSGLRAKRDTTKSPRGRHRVECGPPHLCASWAQKASPWKSVTSLKSVYKSVAVDSGVIDRCAPARRPYSRLLIPIWRMLAAPISVSNQNPKS